MKAAFTNHAKYLALLFAILFTSCATTVRIPPVDAYILSDGVATYYNLSPTSPETGLIFHQNDKVRIVKRKDPGWLIFLWQGKEVYIAKAHIGTQPVSTTPTPSANTAPLQPSYGPSRSSHSIRTGPRGGRYYINGNGNKTYIKRK